MRFITIRFAGLCCHVDMANSFGVKRRAILQKVKMHPHITYIEFFPGQLDRAASPQAPASKFYRRQNVQYERIDVQNVKISVKNNILSKAFMLHPKFEQNVPSLREVCPSFREIKPEFLTETIATETVAAYFDMTLGVLTSGPLETYPTEFVPANRWPKKRLARGAELELEIAGDRPTIVLEDLGNGTKTELTFEDGTELTIGNQSLDDLLGRPNNGRLGHWDEFYELAVEVSERPQPKGGGLGLGTGCTNSGYP